MFFPRASPGQDCKAESKTAPHQGPPGAKAVISHIPVLSPQETATETLASGLISHTVWHAGWQLHRVQEDHFFVQCWLHKAGSTAYASPAVYCKVFIHQTWPAGELQQEGIQQPEPQDMQPCSPVRSTNHLSGYQCHS